MSTLDEVMNQAKSLAKSLHDYKVDNISLLSDEERECVDDGLTTTTATMLTLDNLAKKRAARNENLAAEKGRTQQ